MQGLGLGFGGFGGPHPGLLLGGHHHHFGEMGLAGMGPMGMPGQCVGNAKTAAGALLRCSPQHLLFPATGIITWEMPLMPSLATVGCNGCVVPPPRLQAWAAWAP